jgi:hypothetical protein
MENVAPFIFIGIVVLVIGYVVWRNFLYTPKPPVPPVPPTPPKFPPI